MESQTPPVTALSRADAKDQVDQTWFTGFVVSVPDQNKGKTSSEVELDTQTLLLTITADVQAIMLSNDDLFDESYNDVFEAVPTEEPVSQEHQSSTPHKEKPESSTTQKTDTSYSESYSCSNTFKPYENYMPIIERQLTDHNTSMRRILENLKEVQEVVKEDLALNKKVLESTKAYTKNSLLLLGKMNMLLNGPCPPHLWLGPFGPRMTNIELTQDAFQSDVSSLKQDTSEIKSMMTEIFNAFKGKSFAHTATEKPPSYTEGEKADMDTKEAVKKEQPKDLEVEKSVQEPVRASSQFQPQFPLVAPKADKGKGIATDDVKSPKKLVKASSKVHLGPDEPVREEKMKKADEEAKQLAISNPELIKVIHKEASKAKINPTTLGGAKGGQEFKKIQDAKIREHSQKIKKAMKLKKKRLDQHIKRKIMELELEIRIPGLECNKSLPKNVPFFNNMVTEEPEYRMFFIDVFGDQAFQRMNDIHKFNIETLLTYLVMASNITTPENTRFCLKLRKLIENYLDQEKLKSKKVKLEFVG
ncbi:hypothetical protein Tco_1415066 [Tanacetum coccineum]